MTSIDRVYAGRLSGMIVRNPDGDAIGRARDVVVRLRPSGAPSRALGLVLQLTDKRRVFVPMGRITAIEPNEILLNSGLVSMRQFKARPGESTVLGDLVGSKVQIDDPDLEHLHGVPQELTDVEMERSRTRDWILTRVAVLGPKRGLRGRRDVAVAPWNHVHGLGAGAEDLGDLGRAEQRQVGRDHQQAFGPGLGREPGRLLGRGAVAGRRRVG